MATTNDPCSTGKPDLSEYLWVQLVPTNWDELAVHTFTRRGLRKLLQLAKQFGWHGNDRLCSGDSLPREDAEEFARALEQALDYISLKALQPNGNEPQIDSDEQDRPIGSENSQREADLFAA